MIGECEDKETLIGDVIIDLYGLGYSVDVISYVLKMRPTDIKNLVGDYK